MKKLKLSWKLELFNINIGRKTNENYTYGTTSIWQKCFRKFHTGTDHEVVAVYCAPDKEGKPLDPVKEYAQSVGLPVFQPSNFKDQEVLDQIKSHDADLCVMAYVIIFVPEAARDIPKHGSICFHPSLLPYTEAQAPLTGRLSGV